MGKQKFKIIEEDGIVIYDERDDYVPGEDRIDVLCELEGNEELNMGYILATEQQRDAEMRWKMCRDRLISIAVITSIVLYVTVLCRIFL